MERASSAYGRDLAARDIVLLAAAIAAGAGVYLLASAFTYRLGFPLDDSWIHATFARNLVVHGEWAFQVGRLSAGSTSPLWTLLLTPGYLLNLAPLWWSFLLGSAALLGLCITVEITARSVIQAYRPSLPWIGLFFAAEWHMLWAAVSGMETLLHTMLATAILGLLMRGSRRYLGIGLLTGMSVWVRPDGLTLAGPCLLTILLVETKRPDRWRGVTAYLMGMGSFFLPYLAFNLALAGTPMPNTFYAKQAEYAAWQARPFLYRAGVTLAQLATGAAALLLPAAVGYVIHASRRRNVPIIAAAAWCFLYMLLYVLRLPAYQHARYLMPAMPVLLLLGLFGFLRAQESKHLERSRWVFERAWKSAVALLTAGFFVLGARAYGQDVGLIESEMVNTAKWVSQNVPPDAVVAAHDVGALGYFDEHPLLDLAGLVSPEVLPFIRDEAKLSAFLDQRHASYLVAFPSLYPKLAEVSKPVYSSGGRFAPASGEQNMTVYCWRCH
jgi:hypothetical protein